MGNDFARIILGCLFLLILGPILWVPSLFGLAFRQRSRRVQQLTGIFGAKIAASIFVALGGLVSLIGVWYIATGVQAITRPSKFPIHVPQPADLPTLVSVRSLDSKNWHTYGLVFSPDGQRLLTSDTSLREWDLATGEQLQAIHSTKLGLAEQRSISAAAVSADRQQIVLGFTEKSIRDRTGAVVRLSWSDLTQHKMVVTPFEVDNVSISNSGRHAVAVVDFPTGQQRMPKCVVVDFETAEVHVVEIPAGSVQAAIHPTQDLIVVASGRADLVLLDLMTRDVVKELKAPGTEPRGYCTGLAVARNGRLAATWHFHGGDQSLRLWNLEEGRLVQRSELTGGGVSTAVFTDDSTRILTGGRMDGAVGVWQCRPLKPLALLVGDEPTGIGTARIAVSPDDRWVAMASRATCFLWNDIAIPNPHPRDSKND